MGHESDGFFGAIPQLQQLLVQMIAHNFIKRAKGFVHQQDIRIKRQVRAQ